MSIWIWNGPNGRFVILLIDPSGFCLICRYTEKSVVSQKAGSLVLQKCVQFPGFKGRLNREHFSEYYFPLWILLTGDNHTKFDTLIIQLPCENNLDYGVVMRLFRSRLCNVFLC